MKFVFFDIECACVSKRTAKICAFGYCVTDENFHIVEKRDLLINPQGGFHLTDRKGEKGIVLPYDYEKFKEKPTFPEVYPQLKELLTQADAVFGHSVMNDVKYLNLETARFSLPPLEFSFYDTQFIYMNKIGRFDKQLALGTIARALNVEFTAHRAADDAYATMRIAEALCREENKDFFTLVKDYGVLPGRTKGGVATDCTSFGRERYLERAHAEKEARERARVEFISAVDGKRPKRRSQKLKGKIFCFHKQIEENVGASKEYVKKIYENGGNYSLKPNGCNVYVAIENDTSLRLKNAAGAGAEIVDESRLKELLS